MPQMATFATPGTDNRAGRISQRASTDIWIGDTCFEDSPTIMTRLVADRGCRMTGGFATFGNVYARLRRSLINCRARIMSVPGWKKSTTDESPGTDVERIVLSHGVPFSNSSRLRLINSSTSDAESPGASVCTSTYGGANSGKASTGMSRSWLMPTNIIAAARATTKSRNLRLHPTIQCIMAHLPAQSMSTSSQDGL